MDRTDRPRHSPGPVFLRPCRLKAHPIGTRGGKPFEMTEATKGTQIHTRWVQPEKGSDEILMEVFTGEGSDEVKMMEIASKRKK